MRYDSKYWGAERISQREDPFNYTPNERPVQTVEERGSVKKSNEAEASKLYHYNVPDTLGEDVIIYVIETEVSFKADYLDIPNERYSRLPATEKDPFFKGAEDRGDSAEIHGTIVANIAAGDQYGAAPKARVVIVHRNTKETNGLKTALQEIITHYDDLKEPRPPAIVNASFGQRAPLVGEPVSPLQGFLECNGLIDELTDKRGILIVAAAGNTKEIIHAEDCREIPNYKIAPEADRPPLAKEDQTKNQDIIKGLLNKKILLPAGHPKVLSVGAHDEKDDCTKCTSGSGVDIYAPGFYVPYFIVRGQDRKLVDTRAPNSKGNTQVQGSSFAAPLVAGSIASRISQREKTHQARLTPQAWIDLVKDEARRHTVGDEVYLLYYSAPQVPVGGQ